MSKRGLKLIATATVERNSTDVAAAVSAIHGAGPDMVVMISAYKSCAAFIKSMQHKGSTALFCNVSFVGSRSLARELGADGVVS